MCDYTPKDKIKFEGFTQNGRYSNQTHPSKV